MLTYIEGISLEENFVKRLTVLGLTPSEIEKVQAELEKHKQAWLQQQAARQAENITHTVEATRPTADATANTATHEAEAAIGGEKSFLSSIKNMSNGAKWGVAAATTALVGTIGYWAWHTKQSTQRKQNANQQQTATAR